MEPRVILYRHMDEGISVTVEAYFSDGTLVVEGYDIGKRVEEYWGDSDYEYSTVVAEELLPALYQTLGVSTQAELLNELQIRFSGNHSYSQFQQFLESAGIPYSAQSWT